MGTTSIYFTNKQTVVFIDVKICVGLSRGVFNARSSEYLANFSVRRLVLGIHKILLKYFFEVQGRAETLFDSVWSPRRVARQ